MKERQRRTKILATLGPATDAPGVLDTLFKAGVNVVRLNFSHGGIGAAGERDDALRCARTTLIDGIGNESSARRHSQT